MMYLRQSQTTLHEFVNYVSCSLKSAPHLETVGVGGSGESPVIPSSNFPSLVSYADKKRRCLHSFPRT